VYVIPTIMLLAGMWLYVANPPFLQALQFRVFDLYQQTKPRPYIPVPVKIIDIDEDSLLRFGQWPWPRRTLARMVTALFEAGTQVLAFDIVFAEADRTSPSQVLPVWLGQRELNLEELPADYREFARSILESVPDNDAVFVDVIRQVGELSNRHGVVAGYAFTTDGPDRTPIKGRKFGIAVAGNDPRGFLDSFRTSAPNLPEIERAASGIGSFNMVLEADSIVRRIPTMLRLGEEIYPSLSAEAVRLYQGARTYILKASGANKEESFGENTGLNHVKIGRIEVPVDEGGGIWMHYTDYVAERYIPAWKILEADFDSKLVEGHILFFGTSAAGLKDLRSTPLNLTSPGVEIHAQAAEQMLLGHFLRRPDFALGAELSFIAILGLLLVMFTPRFGAALGAAIGFGAVALAVGGSWIAYSEYLWLFDPLYPSITIVGIFGASTIVGYLDTEAEKRAVRGAFQQYLSPAMVELVAQDPSKLALGGEMKEMTFLFCDVRDFTSIAERFKTDPQGLTWLINRFLTPMTDAIMARDGTIDKYMGDCIMAFWNAPLDDLEHARHACDSALAMLEELRSLNAQFVEEAGEDEEPLTLNIGIGLNTGHCAVGNMGSQQRFDYSVLGDAVNTASRLEGQSKTYGVGIVIGEDTCLAAPEFATLELDLIAVKGKIEAVRVFALMGRKRKLADPAFATLTDTHGRMLAAYRVQDWAAARALVGECRALDESLGELQDLYDERIEFYQENPPGPDWDGVFVATTK
ncbi:MAG: adenylate/guanylate cyclase domain-containing protein, partial [Myxococcota bacterium]